MVGRVVSLLLALFLLLSQHTWAGPALDPAKFDWAQCEQLASCYVPGKCIGRIEGLMSLSRRPFDNCTVGIIMEIKSADHIELTVVTEVQAKTVHLNWMALKPAYTCHSTDTVEKSVTSSKSVATITNYVPIVTAKGMKCKFGFKQLSGVPLRDSLFMGTNYDSTFEMEIIDSTGKITSYVGYTIYARNEMQFRVPDASIDWTVCSDDDKTCLVSGKCDGGRETQLRVPENPITTCNNGVIAKIVTTSEWQITIYVEADGEIKDKVVLNWLGLNLFSCEKTDNKQAGASKLFKAWILLLMPSHIENLQFDIIRHIPFYDKAKKSNNFLFDDIDKKSKAQLYYTITDINLGDKLINFTGYTDDIRTAMTHKMKFGVHVCVGCEKAKTTEDTVVYTPGPCELYTCANPKTKMVVNNRFMMESMLKCDNTKWRLQKFEMENGNEQFIDIETLDSVSCAEKYDCHQMYPLKSSCGSTADTTCRKIDIAQRPFHPICDKGFSLVFFPSKNTKRDPVRITSIRCDESAGHWEMFIEKTRRLVMAQGGTVVCIVDGYELPKFNALKGGQEADRKQESNIALKVSLCALAVIFAIAIILIIAFFIITKIKTREETPDDLPEGTPVIHPTPILTVQKMDAKRKMSLIAT